MPIIVQSTLSISTALRLDLYPVVQESLKSSIFPPEAEITAAIIST